MSSSRYITGAVPLSGIHLIAAWRAVNHEGLSPRESATIFPAVVISQGAATEDGAYIPAVDITVVGTDALLALRRAIDQALDAGWSKSAI